MRLLRRQSHQKSIKITTAISFANLPLGSVKLVLMMGICANSVMLWNYFQCICWGQTNLYKGRVLALTSALLKHWPAPLKTQLNGAPFGESRSLFFISSHGKVRNFYISDKKFDAKLYVAIFLSISWHVKEMDSYLGNACCWPKWLQDAGVEGVQITISEWDDESMKSLQQSPLLKLLNPTTTSIFRLIHGISTYFNKKNRPRKFWPTLTRNLTRDANERCLSYVLVVLRRDSGNWSPSPRDL